jgi:hypothetical protein
MKKITEKILSQMELGKEYANTVDKVLRAIHYLEKAYAEEAEIYASYNGCIYAYMEDTIYRFMVETDGFFESHCGYGRNDIYTKEEFTAI